jgi:pyrroline-5-carboxylate reductase
MTVGLIGCDGIATALARGGRGPILYADAELTCAAELAIEVGGQAFAEYATLARQADVVVLCHAPAQLGEIAESVAPHARAVVSTLSDALSTPSRGLCTSAGVSRGREPSGRDSSWRTARSSTP